MIGDGNNNGDGTEVARLSIMEEADGGELM